MPVTRPLIPLAGLLILIGGLAGCATRPETPQLQAVDRAQGYYGPVIDRPNNSPEFLFIMALSGGGTRAASLSYGVLEELARTPSPKQAARSLLQEVDGISAVSGGSFTATAYAYYGDRIFTEFEGRFLKRDVQSVLVWQTLNPLNWPRLWSGLAGRSDLAADYYDKILFNKATFGDLPRDSRPFVLVNATDVSTGVRFEFTQTYFDLICGDLSRFPIARAVAASSAVPVVLSPITLDNRGGACAYEQPKWMQDALAGNTDVPHRAVYRARELTSFGDQESRPYIHLIDGGVTDNLGLRAIMDGLLVGEATRDLPPEYREIRRIAILLVNAEQRPKVDWDRKPNPPGVLNLGRKSSSIPMARYSYETVELLTEKIAHWKALADERRGETGSLEFYLIDVSFEQVADKTERQYLQNLVTSFNLPDGDVDHLREVAGRVLRQSSEYQRLMADLARDRAGSD
jgi:NTE family protein